MLTKKKEGSSLGTAKFVGPGECCEAGGWDLSGARWDLLGGRRHHLLGRRWASVGISWAPVGTCLAAVGICCTAVGDLLGDRSHLLGVRRYLFCRFRSVLGSPIGQFGNDGASEPHGDYFEAFSGPPGPDLEVMGRSDLQGSQGRFWS